MSSETVALITAVLASLTAYVAVFLAGWVARRASQDQRRSDKRIDTLIEAFRKLDQASNRRSGNDEIGRMVESAISDVILLGNEDEVRAAIQFANEFAENGSADLTKLLRVLRSSLRQEHNLEQIDEYASLRISG